MKSVIISCVPKLNDTQQAGMLRLINDFEASGYKVYLWTDNNGYTELDAYQLLPDAYSKKRAYGYYMYAQMTVESEKWIARLQRWNNNDTIIAKQEYNNLLKEGIKLFAAVKPDYFVCWNPWSCRFGVAYDTARALKINTAAIEWGFLPDTFILDKQGTLAASKIFNTGILHGYNTADAETGQQIFDQLKQKSLSLYSQDKPVIPNDFLNPRKGVKILVLGIDEVDSGAVPAHHAERRGLLPFHESSFLQAEAIAQQSTRYKVIFKPHPAHNRYSNNFEKNNLAVVNGNPDDLIDWADVVFCSGSKMEFSVILKKKPLLTFGAGLLYGKNCSYEVKQPAEISIKIEEAIINAHSDMHCHNFILFLQYLHNNYLYHFTRNNGGLSTYL